MSLVEQALRRVKESARGRASQPEVPAPAAEVRAAVDTEFANAQRDKRSRGVRPLTLPCRTDIAPIDFSEDKLRACGFIGPANSARVQGDQFRVIKRKLLGQVSAPQPVPGREDARHGGEGRFIMVASALPNDGKTFASVNLAMSIAAERELAVILFDADVPKSHLSRDLRQGGQPGLLDYLASESMKLSSIVAPTTVAGLYFVPVGGDAGHAADLMASSRMTDLLIEMTEQYPHCVGLFDSSPLLVAPDSQVLARAIDQVLLVVRAEVTPREAVAEALAGLEESKAITLMLNSWTPLRFFRGGTYGTYYGYGSRAHEQPR